MPDEQPIPSLEEAVHADRARLGGAPVFRGTRVPVKALFDYLQAGKSAHEFLADFEGVSPAAVHAVLATAERDVLRDVQAA
jgi:uncharacterized protein (DUF433 family)